MIGFSRPEDGIRESGLVDGIRIALRFKADAAAGDKLLAIPVHICPGEEVAAVDLHPLAVGVNLHGNAAQRAVKPSLFLLGGIFKAVTV